MNFSENYFLEDIEAVCNECNNPFKQDMPYNNELVAFDCDDNITRYLPIYGNNGYIELMRNLGVDVCNIRQQDIVLFEESYSKKLPYSIKLRGRIKCPFCGSNNCTVKSREIKEKPKGQWVKLYING